MAKAKSNPGVQNKIIYSRASYLYQAANYLASRADDAQHGPAPVGSTDQRSVPRMSSKQRQSIQNMSRQAVSDMRAVSLKAQIRQGPALKRTICKFCDTLQIEGQTCQSVVENPSKGCLKPWADVLVIKCNTCGNSKRYPVSAPRQKRRALRPPRPDQATGQGKTDATKGSRPGTSACLL
ncbi:RNAse P Rpr2/Rpp21 subunit domain-containing protein [Tolypocladium capitatum]|uniref:RNAse P Rpr2/Rpp21 subunit domain-containing protein n=1 Tax=Tolypocladium capitatum TaxID=45235 RepID=A0A2K3QGY8_9HYPO|nr:RNAse P Rpr2/Rpp21 subunit domain-containing protein [Tolypocladium capitatum]